MLRVVTNLFCEAVIGKDCKKLTELLRRDLLHEKLVVFESSGILLSDSKLNATESPKLFATEKKSLDIIVLPLE
jgi:hypothetical protein